MTEVQLKVGVVDTPVAPLDGETKVGAGNIALASYTPPKIIRVKTTPIIIFFLMIRFLNAWAIDPRKRLNFVGSVRCDR